MLIRSTLIITIFAVTTFLSSCQKDEPETTQKSTQETTNSQNLNILKTKITQAMVSTALVKMAVTEHYDNNGQFSGAANLIGSLPANVSLDNDTGRITLHLKGVDNSMTEKDTIQLTPEATNIGISWHCKSNISKELLPPTCR